MMLNREFRSSLILLSCNLAKSINASMESALIPVPLCLDDLRIVLQMSPGISCVWIGTGGVFWYGIVGTGLEYKLLTTSMLFSLMVAMELDALIRFRAVL